MVLQILSLLGALGLFLYGMNMLSSSLQKLYGDKLRRYLPWMTSTRFMQVAGGFCFTTATLYSRATTLMIVTSVEAGILTLAQAVGAIMGANIGTTVTAWIITIFGFSLNITLFCYPLMLIGFVCTMIKSTPTVKTIGETIIAVALVFLGLKFMQTSMLSLNESSNLIATLSSMAGHGFGSVLIYLLAGTIISFLIQSSSATVALTLILLSMGWIPFNLAAAVVLGANLGTTLTLALSTSKSNYQARRAANIHLIFKVTAVLLAFIFFNPLVNFVGWIISLFGGSNPATGYFSAGTPLTSTAPLYGIALYHTLISLLATLAFIWFTDKIVEIVTKIVKEPEKEPEVNRFKYINTTPLGAPAISIMQAMKEVANFGETCLEEVALIKQAVNETDPDKFEEVRNKLVEYEEITDKMEIGIANFLNDITGSNLNNEETAEIKRLYRIISELESFGDSGENISRTLDRERVHNQKFDETFTEKINFILRKVESACSIMNFNLQAACTKPIDNIDNARAAEDEINNARDTLREEAMGLIGKHDGNYQSINYFLDLISELEAMGDFMINVSQSLLKPEKK